MEPPEGADPEGRLSLSPSLARAGGSRPPAATAMTTGCARAKTPGGAARPEFGCSLLAGRFERRRSNVWPTPKRRGSGTPEASPPNFSV